MLNKEQFKDFLAGKTVPENCEILDIIEAAETFNHPLFIILSGGHEIGGLFTVNENTTRVYRYHEKKDHDQPFVVKTSSIIGVRVGTFC